MKLFKFTACIAVAAVLTLCSSVQAQSVVLSSNGDFETPFDGNLVGNFGVFTGSANATSGQDTTAPFAGSTHASIGINGDTNSFAGIQQDVGNIITGATYGLDLYARSLGVDLGGIDGEFRIEWLDAAGGFVGGQFDNNQGLGVTDTYSFFSQSSVAPAGAVTLRAVVAVQSFGAGADGSDSEIGTLFVDNLSVTGPAPVAEIPEPTSLALLGLATAGLAVRRRRS